MVRGSLFPVVKRDRLRGHDRRDCVLVNKLALPIAAQQDTEVIKPGDDPLQLHAVDQENGHWNLCLSDMVQECVLKVLFV